jgi:hypothetical protein
MKGKIRNHYVWRHYLKPWTNKSGKIICKREGKIIETGTTNIGLERYFYKIKLLTIDDFTFIKKIFLNENNPVTFSLNEHWFKMFSWVNMLVSLKDKINDNNLLQELEKLTNDFNENIYNFIENTSIKYLDFLYKKDISFYDNENDNLGFNIFICEQYFRTKEMKKRMMGTHVPIKNVNYENCWNIISHVLATNLAATLTAKRNDFQCILLNNNTDIPFYTSDQPVINIAAEKAKLEKLTNYQFEFYYPITPKIAILISLKEISLGGKGILALDETGVKNYNAKVLREGGETIFSNTRIGLI